MEAKKKEHELELKTKLVSEPGSPSQEMIDRRTRMVTAEIEKAMRDSRRQIMRCWNDITESLTKGEPEVDSPVIVFKKE